MEDKENRNTFYHSEPLTKHVAYTRARSYHHKGNPKEAEIWAIKAMRLGSENSAPQLLAEIVMETKSKHTAMTLASYYFHEQQNLDKTEHWANIAITFGSKTLAKELLAKIAHVRAVELHQEIKTPSF